MRSVMNYQTPAGVYTGVFAYDDEADLFHGEVVNVGAVLTFQGRSIDELKQALKDTVDDYLEWCKERGKEPQKPLSGNIPLRLGPQLHRDVAAAALQEKKSLNQFVRDVLADHIARGGQVIGLPPAQAEAPRLPMRPVPPSNPKEQSRRRKRA